MRLFNIELGKPKASAQYQRGKGKFVSRWTRPPSRNTAEWLEMYSKSPRLAVVEKIATDLSSLSGHLYRVNPDGTETELTKHPFLDFMAYPNPLYEMTSSALWRLNEIHLMLVGESFFLIERDENERPTELWNVPPHWVKMTPYLGNPGYMITTPSGLTMTVPVDDMFVMKHLNPLDPFARGLGVAESIADEVEIDEFAAQFQKRFFYNDGTPSMLFIFPDASKDQADSFLARWNKKHRGVENSHKAAALGGNVDIKTFGSEDIRELGFVESRLSTRDAVLEHFGVPREIMGITENSNRSTADSAQYIYAKNVLTPRIQDREKAINQQLLPLFGDNLVWRFDPVIPYDKEFDKALALDGWNAGLLTKNEARAKLDMPEVRGGNVFKVGINDLFMEQTADPVEVSQTLTESRGEKKADPRVNIEAMLREEDAALRENERRFELAIARHFADQRSAIAKALGMTVKAESDALAALDDLLMPDGTFDPEMWAALTELEQQKLTEAVAAGLLNWKDEAKKLTAIFTPLWKQAYADGAEVAAESYGLVDLVRPELVSQAKLNGGKRVVGIQATTQKNIADIIARGVENGASQRSLRTEILTEMGPETTRARAKLIAQQETAMSLATGQFDTMKAAGATTKEWHHRDPQKDPRDGTHGKVDHVHLEGETVAIDEPFSNGLMYPRDPNDGRPEEVIRCRCYLTFGGF
jgi:HK97 family phage portal protein